MYMHMCNIDVHLHLRDLFLVGEREYTPYIASIYKACWHLLLAPLQSCGEKALPSTFNLILSHTWVDHRNWQIVIWYNDKIERCKQHEIDRTRLKSPWHRTSYSIYQWYIIWGYPPPTNSETIICLFLWRAPYKPSLSTASGPGIPPIIDH